MNNQLVLPLTEFLTRYTPTFVNDPPEKLKCILCKDILKNAKQTSCGCKVCEKCIKDYLENKEKPCPSKECEDIRLKYDRDIHQDNAINKEISKLIIKCVYKTCAETDTIRDMVGHIETCEHREVKCNKCYKMYPYKSKSNHDQNECEQRMVQCPHCKQQMIAINLLTIHLNVDDDDLCSIYIGDCPNECGAKSLNIKEHLSKCANPRLECPFNQLQCGIGKLTKGKLEEHLQEETISHYGSLISEFKAMKDQNRRLNEKLENVTNLLNEQINLTDNLKEKVQKSLNYFNRKSSGNSLNGTKSLIFRNGSFIWKIVNFQTLKIDAESRGRASMTSFPFYTSEFGYKMCLRVYPAGDGIGKGSHLSLFYLILNGSYDDILTWPFNQKITISLLDQENNGSNNHSHKFKPDAKSACYQKPVNNCNTASGSPKFIPLSSILPSSIYYKNDTIFLRILVEPIKN